MIDRANTVLHATALHIDGRGVLLTGPSGAGKSQLAYALMEMAKRDGLPFGLIADDCVAFRLKGQDVEMVFPPNAPESLRGSIEMRGFGIVKAPFCEAHRLTHAYVLYKDEAAADSLRQIPKEQDWPKIELPLKGDEAISWSTCPVFSKNIAHCAKIIALHAGFALPL